MKDIPGYEGLYAITEDGRVWSYPKQWIGGMGRIISHSGKWISQTKNKKGYSTISIGLLGNRITIHVHRLVALTYIPNPHNRPQVNHIDGNKINNHVSNLEWCTNGENQLHAFKNQLNHSGKLHPHARKVISDTGLVFETVTEACNYIGKTSTAIKNAIRQNTRAGGFYWRYLDG